MKPTIIADMNVDFSMESKLRTYKTPGTRWRDKQFKIMNLLYFGKYEKNFIFGE